MRIARQLSGLRLRGLQGALVSAVVWILVASAGLVFQFEPLLALQLRIADFAFLQEGGPLLGVTGPHRDDIVVLHDDETGTWAYTTADVQRDIALYNRLLDDGALAVGDLRFRGPGKESEELMEGLVALEEKGLVLRQFDINVSERSRIPHSAPSLYWFDSSHDLAQNIRFYPILAKQPDGLRECLAVRLARAYLGLESPLKAEYPQSARGYQIAPDRFLPALYRPSKGASQLVGDYVLWINYHGPPGTYPSLPLKDVQQGKVEPNFFRDKLVIVDVGEMGALGTPASVKRPMNDGEIDANVVQSIIEQHFLAPQGITEGVIGVVLVTVVGSVLFFQLRPVIAVLVLVLLLGGYLTYGTASYRSGIVPDVFFGSMALLGTFVSTSIYQYVGEARARRREEEETRRVRETFGRYVAQPVVDKLLQDPSAVVLGGKRQEVTILFADIRGYTTFSEQTSPEDIVNMLNTYLTAATAGILAHEGTVDKYIGDAIMAYFNAPLLQEDHALRAVKAALEMQESLRSTQTGQGPSCGIGIHTGVAIVGNVGSPQLMSYTVIGDAVNVASRLQSNASNSEILISEATYDKVRGLVDVDTLEPLQVKGRSAPVAIYRLKAIRGQ